MSDIENQNMLTSSLLKSTKDKEYNGTGYKVCFVCVKFLCIITIIAFFVIPFIYSVYFYIIVAFGKNPLIILEEYLEILELEIEWFGYFLNIDD